MNRISDKPYIEIPDFEDESKENEIASHFWEHHKARNDSIIVDLFQGQFKSKLICNQCNKVNRKKRMCTLYIFYYVLYQYSFFTFVIIKVSITFDPFMHLSLPIPVNTYKLNITFIYYSTSDQAKFTIYLRKGSTIHDLKQEIRSKLKDIQHVKKGYKAY